MSQGLSRGLNTAYWQHGASFTLAKVSGLQLEQQDSVTHHIFTVDAYIWFPVATVTVCSWEPYQVEHVRESVVEGFFFLFRSLNPQSDAAIHHFLHACFQLAAGPPPCLGLPLWHQGGELSAGQHVGLRVSPSWKDSRNNPTFLGLRKAWELWRCRNSTTNFKVHFSVAVLLFFTSNMTIKQWLLVIFLVDH